MTKSTSTSTTAAPASPAPSEDATDWHFVTPQLPVADVRESQAYYRDMLGFKIAWIWREEYGAVYNGTTEIFFVREEGEIHPSCSFVRVENADEVLAAYRERGVKIVEEIASHPYGMREFAIEDNNGHRFRIGHSSGPVVSPAEGDLS
jgi:catechol 2,3-dioxygenase-like lactoylglutathione lyase family enzyme